MAKQTKQEELDWISEAVDKELSESYNYSGSELYEQMGEAWRRYFRQPYGNEVEGFSQWVSPMVLNHVNDIRAFVTSNIFKNGSPIIKFTPQGAEDVTDADSATQYINHVFRYKNDGYKFVDETIFNGALLKTAVARVTMKTVRSGEEMEFKYEGYSMEEFEEKLALFFVANPELQEQEPTYVKEKGIEKAEDNDYIYACYKWKSKDIIESYPHFDAVSPGNLFVSRQAPSIEDARMVATLSPTTIGELAEEYPDAPAINGIKTKKGAEEFWQELHDGYLSWYNEREWLEKWAYDSLGFYQEQYAQDTTDLGIGAKKVFAIDAEIKIDPDNSGEIRLCRVVKCGQTVLHKAEIAETSFVIESLIPTANRWVGVGVNDIIGQDAKEQTLNTRAFTDATVQAAHENKVVDPEQVEMRDMENLGPDDIIRLKEGAGKKGVPAIETIKASGPDPSVLTAADKFDSIASQLTGVGAAFAGASQDDVSRMRMDKESVARITDRSSLLLNYMSRNYVNNFLCKVLLKALNVAIKGTASPQVIPIASKWNEIQPSGLRPRAQFIVAADVGVDDKQEKQARLMAGMNFLAMATGGGQPGPDGEPMPAIPVQLLDTAGYTIAKEYFEVNELPGFDKVVMDPKMPEGQEQVQSFISQMQQQIPMMVEQGVQQALQAATQAPEVQKMMAETAKITAETEKLVTDVEKQAFEVAEKGIAEERREEAEAWKEAAAMEQNDIKREEMRINMEIKRQEMQLQKEIAEKAAEAKATAVVNP